MRHPANVADRTATCRDVLEAPPNMVEELVSGRLHLRRRPASRHAFAASALGVKLGGPFGFGDQGAGWPADRRRTGAASVRDVLAPDLAG